MQGDLISKSELLESLNDWIDENTDINTILRWIEEFETAYDVEKVEEEIDYIFDRVSADCREILGYTPIGQNFLNIFAKIKILVKEDIRNGGKE